MSSIEKIKKEYDSYQLGLLLKGKFLRETSLGYYGSSPADAVFRFFKKIKLKGSFIDLGSGDGKVTLIAALFTKAKGIEIDDELFNASEKIKNKLGINADFIKGDFLEHDLSKYDVLFLNPDQPFPELEKKLRKEMKKTAKLIVFGSLFKPLNMGLDKSFVIGGFRLFVYTV